MREIVFKNKRNPNLIITIIVGLDHRIKEISNPRGVYFPFKVGQILNMNHKVWACNNNYHIDGQDACGEKKVMGIRVSDIPAGHPLRYIYPNKFKN